MQLRYREANARDLRQSLSILDASSAFEAVRDQLNLFWYRQLADSSMRMGIVEDLDRPIGQVAQVAFVATVFVTDEFLAEIRAGLVRHPSLAAIQLHLEGRSPILNLDGIRRANSAEGLNLLLLNSGCARSSLTPEETSAVLIRRTDELLSTHQGFKCKEFLVQAYDEQSLRMATNMGGHLRDWNQRSDGENVDKEVPHLLGLTRKEAFASPGTWASCLFIYRPPLIFFQPAEQEVLVLALRGADDEEISEHLDMSLSGVKKRWAKIFERAAGSLPELLPGDNDDDNSGRGRGLEKRGHLLRYLREHPEELRPVERTRRAKCYHERSFRGTHGEVYSYTHAPVARYRGPSTLLAKTAVSS